MTPAASSLTLPLQPAAAMSTACEQSSTTRSVYPFTGHPANSRRGSSEKVGRWARSRERSLGRGLNLFPVLGVRQKIVKSGTEFTIPAV